MKLLEKNAIVDQPGTVKIVPEHLDDLWLLYHLISAGDSISAITTRKFNGSTCSDSAGCGKKTSTFRVRMELEIKVTAIDPYHKNSPVLRVRGKTAHASNNYVKTGAFHTIELEMNKEFQWEKYHWDQETFGELNNSCKASGEAGLAVVLMHEGLANLFLLKNKTTDLCTTVTETKSTTKFFERVFRVFVEHVDFSKISCAVFGSPGSLKDEFTNYLLSESKRSRIKPIEHNKSRIITVKTRSGEKSCLSEVLNSLAVTTLVKGAKALTEAKAFSEFKEALSNDNDRACYGLKTVEKANEMMAIKTLLITEDMYKNQEMDVMEKYISEVTTKPRRRNKMVELVKLVENSGGKVVVFSSGHVTCQELANMTGIAAVLRFPLPDLDDLEL